MTYSDHVSTVEFLVLKAKVLRLVDEMDIDGNDLDEPELDGET